MSRRTDSGARRDRQAGFFLFEVLVAVFITAMGLLGMMAVQANSVQSSGASAFRSAAVQTAGDLADRIRANTAGFAQYAVVSTWAARQGQQVAVPACTADCAPDVTAAIDLARWQNAIVASMPNAAGLVLPRAGGQGHDIVVAWKEPSSDDPSAVRSEQCPADISAPGSVRCFTLPVIP